MPMYEIERIEHGEWHKTYKVLADDKEHALDKLFDGEAELTVEYFKQRDADNEVTRMRDCDCDICERRGPWACYEDEHDL